MREPRYTGSGEEVPGLLTVLAGVALLTLTVLLLIVLY